MSFQDKLQEIDRQKWAIDEYGPFGKELLQKSIINSVWIGIIIPTEWKVIR